MCSFDERLITMDHEKSSQLMGAIQRVVKLNLLSSDNPGLVDGIMYGIVIGKVEMRTLEGSDRHQRSVLNFTFRDSIKDFVNVAYWLPPKDLIIISSKFTIGDVVAIHYPVVKAKSDDKAHIYTPWTPLSIELSLNEKSYVEKIEGPKAKQYESLVSIPCRAGNDYYTLAQIVTHGEQLVKKNDGINVLAGVQQIGALKTIRIRRQRETDYDNEEKQLLEILLFDGETSGVWLTFWDSEQIKFAQRWIPEEHIIFCVGLRVRYDEYRKVYGLTATRQSLFTINPDTNESVQLYESMRSISIDDLLNVTIDGGFNALQATVVTIRELKQYLSDNNSTDTFIVQCFLSHLDLDGPLNQVITKRCIFCNRSIRDNNGFKECTEAECRMKLLEQINDENLSTKEVFSLNVHLTDHTGTITNVKLGDDVARKMLKCSVDEFILMTDEQKTKLKWTYLLEKIRFGIQIKNNSNYAKPIVRIACLFPREYLTSSIDDEQS
ncbi:unnamed protein product [Rotaria sordida]|uniref:MEIOB-like N-terminal domain-containing protein n=1 Tax=Rotaria sordida TaxID=392033 RepID=A0A813YRS9_9BILA|nr:unnamed protein product [Rotaria sordida]CAF3974269.1 unnamed protein product [Rotaria sordida]